MVITIPVDELIEEVGNRLEKSNVVPDTIKADFIKSAKNELHQQISNDPDQYVHTTILEMADIIIAKLDDQFKPLMNLMRSMNKEEKVND